MDKALYNVINLLVLSQVVKASSGKGNMDAIRANIRSRLPKKTRKRISNRDIMLAADMVVKRLQEETNCNAMVRSTRNYYNAVPTTFDMNECGKYKIRRISV